MPESKWSVGTCICMLLNFCNLSNQTAISSIRLQSPITDCNLHNQTAIQEDCSLIADIAVWFWKWVKIRGPEIEASHWLRAQNRGLWLVERTGFKKFKALAFHSEISVIPLISDCNIVNQTVISTIRLQSQQSDCNLSNQTAISAIRKKHLAKCLTPCGGLGHV